MIDFSSFEYVKSFGTGDQLTPSTKPEVAFCGRSNVGKSSLLNKLCSRKSLARVSSTPGKTTTINFFEGRDCIFADLPGYGFARRALSEKQRWGELMERYFNSDRAIRLVVQLIDGRREPTEDDYEMLDFMAQTGQDFIIVLTKWDKLNKTEQAARLDALNDELVGYGDISVCPFSALKDIGTLEIRGLISEYI